MNLQLSTSYSTSIQCMSLSGTVSVLETTSGFGEIEITEIPPPFSSQTLPHRFHRCTQTDRRDRTHYCCGHDRHTDAHRQTDVTECITTRHTDVIECGVSSFSYFTWTMFSFSPYIPTGENPRRGKPKVKVMRPGSWKNPRIYSRSGSSRYD